MSKKMNPVVHFEMPADDLERLKKFYSDVFGWNMMQMGEEMGNYVLAQTDETDDKGMLKETNRINGGFYPRQAGQGTHVVIAVDNIRDHMKHIAEAGGTVEGEPMEIPGIGQFVMFRDTEGNRVGALQPKM